MNAVNRRAVLSQRFERFSAIMNRLENHWQTVIFESTLDDELAVWCWVTRSGDYPSTDLTDVQIRDAMGPLMLAFKREVRMQLLVEYRDSLNGLTTHRRSTLDQTPQAKAFRNMHHPAPEGTVAEIAAKYNVSKSEVRKLKQAGRLHELALRGASHGSSDPLSNSPPSSG